MHSIENLVSVEVQERLEQMNGQKPTDEAYKATADVTLKLIDRVTKMRETDIQAEALDLKKKELEVQAEANRLKEKELEQAKQLKEQEIKETHKSGVRDVFVKVFSIAAPSIVVGALAVGLTIYERTEVVTDTAAKEMWKRVFRLI